MVTDSSLCTFDMDPTTTCKDFRLLFTPYGGGYKVNASNPGQTFYNVFYVGTPGKLATFEITLPYPYVTQGANPVHAYDGITIGVTPTSGPNPIYCLTPGLGVPIVSVSPLPPITLSTYGSAASTVIVVEVYVPASGFIYLNMHLDYGLKGTTGYYKSQTTQGGVVYNNAMDATLTKMLIQDHNYYVFSVAGDQNASDGVCNLNMFKKNPGVGGRAGYKYTVDGLSDLMAIPNAVVTLKDAKGGVLATGTTDDDGCYMLPYKWTGKAATLYVTYSKDGVQITKSIVLKANGFVDLNFELPYK